MCVKSVRKLQCKTSTCTTPLSCLDMCPDSLQTFFANAKKQLLQAARHAENYPSLAVSPVRSSRRRR